ncbi:ParM/StbA family protein [Geoalkalibacter halelectricus]|uniref:ParM/StbA family protein n=1 Tax=Geoalkalibacter halelectricus TaxID=2847045 RepID=UPI0026702D1B|nr:ParM/StbA family protein [Geoalkalibacter halelectricus]MDO3380362.1 ParM/StbA family protein [Geoalkalibacter halelectricus]
MSECLVCDLGFSSLKWVYGEKRGRIVSALSNGGGGGERVVGEEALATVSGNTYLRTIEDLLLHYPVFAKEAMKESGASEDAKLVVGLPYGVWRSDKDSDTGLVANLERSLRGEGFGEVEVLPQGLGGVRLYLEDAADAAGNVLGVDIGFNTVIFTLYSPKLKKIIYGDTMYKRGVHQMTTKHLLPRIQRLAPSRTFSPVVLGYIVERGTVSYGMDTIDIREEITAAAEEYFQEVMHEIISELRGHVEEGGHFTDAVFFGGGAALLKDFLQSSKVKVVVMDDPCFANAQGFRLVAGG